SNWPAELTGGRANYVGTLHHRTERIGRGDPARLLTHAGRTRAEEQAHIVVCQQARVLADGRATRGVHTAVSADQDRELRQSRTFVAFARRRSFTRGRRRALADRVAISFGSRTSPPWRMKLRRGRGGRFDWQDAHG